MDLLKRLRPEAAPGEIVRARSTPGVSFFTRGISASSAYMQHLPKVTWPHVHKAVVREVKKTLEVLFLRKGRSVIHDDTEHVNRNQTAVTHLLFRRHGSAASDRNFEVKQGRCGQRRQGPPRVPPPTIASWTCDDPATSRCGRTKNATCGMHRYRLIREAVAR